jgi:uncharacterized membrane protein YdfJ with MMPL/SSD domain
MSASASRGMLTMATRQLMGRWEETSQSWRDSKASDFEATYLADVQATINAAIRTIEELDQLLEKVHANCE